LSCAWVPCPIPSRLGEGSQIAILRQIQAATVRQLFHALICADATRLTELRVDRGARPSETGSASRKIWPIQ